MDEPPIVPATGTRKQQALAFISAYIIRTNNSPSIGDIAKGLGIGATRAKALVHQLANDKAIERAPGAQRAISVPGLFEQLVIDKLRQEGWVVNKDVDAPETCPQGHLPLIAILEHVPAIVAGEHHDHSEYRAAADGR